MVQDYRHVAVAATQGAAVREVPTAAGPADYVLFVDRQAFGVIEAKKVSTTLTGVEWQTRKYRTASPDALTAFLFDGALPFGYESSGTESRFTCSLEHDRQYAEAEAATGLDEPDSNQVDVMQPKPVAQRICDPVCSTGGFFLGAYESIAKRFSQLDPDQRKHLRSGAFTGWEPGRSPDGRSPNSRPGCAP